MENGRSNRRRWVFAVAFAAFTVTFGWVGPWRVSPARADGDDDPKVKLSEAPAAVQKTVKAFAGSDVPNKVERQTKNGKIVYEAKIERGGQKQSIEVGETGDVLQIEKRVEPGTLPAAVKSAVAKAFPGAAVKKAESVHLKGAAAPDFFEIKFKDSKGPDKVRVRPSGEILRDPA